MKYTDINSKKIDSWVENGWIWSKSVSHEEYEDAKKGKYNIKLTPVKYVPKDWIGDVKGKKVLGLASGGAQQMPIFNALGAICTVLDYSEKQLEREREVQQREGYDIEIIKYDMSKPLPFEDETFDMIFHPVSNCYVEEVKPIFKECYRILKKKGRLLSGLDIGINYAFDLKEEKLENTLPFNPLKNKEHLRQMQEEDGGIQFSHTIEEQVNGQIEAGFILKAIFDDTNGVGNLHEHNIASYIATYSIKN
ncbi:MAG: methyltransferase domain-containing protein [Tissierellia bacterium]|nr:methyltransferase domain-containing protein [Tissierellia bacterium]